MSIYYVYQLLDPITLLPFYVGKGCHRRAFYHTNTVKKGRSTENPHKDAVIRQILQSGREPIVLFVEWNLMEEEAYNREEQWINNLGRRGNNTGILTNICTDNRPPSPDPKQQAEKARDTYQLHKWQFEPGQIPWNKGKRLYSTETKRKIMRERLMAWRRKKYGEPRTPLSEHEKKERQRARSRRWKEINRKIKSPKAVLTKEEI